MLIECVSELMTYIALAIHINIRMRLIVKHRDAIKVGLEEVFKILQRIGVRLDFKTNCIDVLASEVIQTIHIDVTNQGIQSDPLFLRINFDESETIVGFKRFRLV